MHPFRRQLGREDRDPAGRRLPLAQLGRERPLLPGQGQSPTNPSTWTVVNPFYKGTPFQVDGLMYTNNAILGSINRNTKFDGAMSVNGSMVCADLGLLVPGKLSTGTQGTGSNLPGSPYKIGLRLNCDARIKDLLDIPNPFEVHLRRIVSAPMGQP